MGNYKRVYGNGIFVTKLNAKELILKKINADTNWVDIYTSAFVLGEDLNTIGSFMISHEISELISKYSSSLFDPDASFETKIQFIEKNISEANTEEVRAYTELLERVKIAEELRILGKILKINQGMPTNTADFYEYISKIEYYIESRLNKQLIDKYTGVRNLTSNEWIGRKKYYDTTVFPYKNAFKLLNGEIKKYGYPYEIGDLLNSDKTELIPELEKAVTTFEDTMRSLGYIGHSYWKDYKAVQEAYAEWYEDLGKVINELKENWEKFSIVRFVKDEDYAQTTISEYESTKVKFNILDVLKSLPHFNEMYKVLALNDRILTVLSKRNEIESKVWQKAIHKYSNGNADILMNTPNKSERKILKSLVDDVLIQTWLTTGLADFYLSSPDGTRLDFDGSLSISKLKSFIETSIIPRLRNNKFIINGKNIDTKSNEFVRRLTFGKHNGESIFKLPFNMSEIDSNPGIKQEYEKILQAFGELRNIHLEGGLTVVDVFYLYNLIVHKDHFGRNSLTRLFEDLISSKDGEKLLVFKFNGWLETVNEEEIVSKVLSSWGASHRNDIQYQNTLSNNLITTFKSVEPTSKLTSKTRTVKYTPKGQAEQTLTIIGTKIFNKEGNEVYSDENNGHRKLIFVELALQEKRAVKVEYRNVTYIVNDRNQIFSTSSNKIVYQNENDGNRIVILESAKEEFAKLSNQSSPRVEIHQGYWIRKEVESQTNKVFLFGDNTDDRVNTHYVPTVTQAVIRGLDNAIGIDTKKNRGTSESSYFTDADFDIFKAQVDEAIQRAINSGKTIVIPADGIGTGKAELDKRAPKLFAYLQQRLDELKKLNSVSPVQFDDSIDISEESVAEEPVTIGFDNTSDRVSEESNESSYIEPIRRLQLLNDYYRPIFTSEELISFEEDAKRIFDNESILNERVNIHYSEWKNLDDITDMRRWEKIWEDIVYDGNAEESENDFKYNNKSKTIQIPKYIYDRIKLYQKYQKLVDFLMGIAQKNNYYDYYGNLLRHDENWFGDLGSTSLDILKDLYDLAGIKEIYDDPNQLKLFDSFHIDSDYIAEREEILRNATRNSEGKLLALNGKISKLTEEQWVTVRTKAFKEWFGDWTKITKNKDGTWNIPDDVSKVIDTETGEPLVVYHGSETVFDKFDMRFFGKTDVGDLGRGHYFAYDEEVALEYGPNIYKVFLNIKNPFIHTGIKTAGVVKNFNREYNPSNREKLLQQIKTAKLNIEEHTRRFKESDEKIFKEINAKKIKYYTALLSGLQTELENTSEEILDSRIVDTLDQYDGVMELKPHYQIVVRYDNQIKSATGAHEFTSSPNIYDADTTPVYQTIPSKQSKLIELVRQANEKGIKGIHIVSQSDLVNEDIYVRSAKGFVRNGEIYINVDRAGDDTIIHEFGHLYLADAKVNNREKYYELLEKVRQTKLWSDMKTWKAYANKIGSDFDEEVLATMIGGYYKSEFGTDYEYTDLVKEALSLVDGGFIDLINSEILPDLGDTFITNYALSQRIATLKHKLVSDNILKENCL